MLTVLGHSEAQLKQVFMLGENKENHTSTHVYTCTHSKGKGDIQEAYVNMCKINWHHSWAFLCLPGGASGKEPACQCRRHKRRGFDPWVGKIPWRKAWPPTPGFLPGESHEDSEEPGGLQSMGVQKVRHD